MASPESAAVSPHIQQKRQRRRDEILRAALRAFREKGYAVTTLDDIASRLGVRKTALYHYFPDKEAILYECHRVGLEEVGRLMQRARRKYRSAAQQLSYLIREHVRVMAETLEGSPSAFEVTPLTPDHQREVIRARDTYERGLREIIQRGIDEGEFRAIDPKTSVFAILGAINWVARWYQPDGSLHADDLGLQFAEFLVGGLKCQ